MMTLPLEAARPVSAAQNPRQSVTLRSRRTYLLSFSIGIELSDFFDRKWCWLLENDYDFD